MKVVVIGGGASGILAALKASEHADVTLIERNNKIGKKILITGNGKCNFWNKEIDTSKYNSSNIEVLEGILQRKDEVYKYLTENLGITPIEKNGYIYPYSKTASSIEETFTRELKKKNISILYDLRVTDLKTNDSDVQVYLSDNTHIKADKVIIATGSKAASKTGSDGSGYDLLSSLGESIVTISPALVPLKISDEEKNFWSGIRTDVKLTIKDNTKIVKEEFGEIQLTDYGISGIVTFNVSSVISKGILNNEKLDVIIDFLPKIDNLSDFLENKNKLMQASSLEELLETLFNYKLMSALLKRANLNKSLKWNNLSREEKGYLINAIKCFKINVIATEDYEKAQVCRGGLSLQEVDDKMSLRSNNNIKVVGELLDVDGICGGYNLAFAFITGYIAGDEIND